MSTSQIFNLSASGCLMAFNILQTLKSANELGLYTIGFLGNGGGEALQYCDSAFIVPSKTTARIQESHITAGHALMESIEDRLIESEYLHLEDRN